MKIQRILFMMCAMLIASMGISQKTTLKSGDFKALKGQQNVDVEFTYNNMIVGKDLKEEKYVERKTKEYNEKEKGKGDTWAISWTNDRERLFHPKFLELFNKGAEGKPLAKEGNEAAEYRLIINTDRIEPGFNVGVTKKPAYINATIKLVRSSDPGAALGEIVVLNCPGSNAMGFDYDTGGRIAECYAKLGKELIAFLQKKQWK